MQKTRGRKMMKIVIVEDEDMIRKGLIYTIDWLSMNSVIVAEAADGEEGLRVILENEPDVVITDIKMPKMNGIDMIQQAQLHMKFKSIILTSYSEFEYAKKAIELKTYDYLLKPIDENKIKSIIQAIHEEIKKDKEEAFLLKNTKNNLGSFDLNYYLQHVNKENDFVIKAINRIEEEYYDKISVESFSEEFGISASYLSRKFKEVTNHTFLDFLNKFRVQQAIKLLNTGQYRVYEISDMTGFTDYKHFCVVFKRYTLMSPTEFIKNK